MEQKATGGGEICKDIISALNKGLEFCEALEIGYLCVI